MMDYFKYFSGKSSNLTTAKTKHQPLSFFFFFPRLPVNTSDVAGLVLATGVTKGVGKVLRISQP